MNKKYFEEIYASAFNDDPGWRRWFMDKVVPPTQSADIIVVHDSAERPSASALVSPYTFLYEDSELKSAYISCVATKPEARTRGLASEAMRLAVLRAARSGCAFAELIPANRSLYFFYNRFGFNDAFYALEDRYTSLHAFANGVGEEIEPSYEVFGRLERQFGCGVLHSESDFKNILSDLDFESGRQVVFARHDTDYACLFAAYDATKPHATVTVRSLMATSDAVAQGALALLRKKVGERPFTVWRPPVSGNRANLRVRGMARVVNAQAVLGALAARHPSLKYAIKLTDSLLPENAGVYRLAGGKCTFEGAADVRCDLTCDVSVLASVLFSAETTGKIFDLPTRRPYMALMLDS